MPNARIPLCVSTPNVAPCWKIVRRMLDVAVQAHAHADRYMHTRIHTDLWLHAHTHTYRSLATCTHAYIPIFGSISAPLRANLRWVRAREVQHARRPAMLHSQHTHTHMNALMHQSLVCSRLQCKHTRKSLFAAAPFNSVEAYVHPWIGSCAHGMLLASRDCVCLSLSGLDRQGSLMSVSHRR
jgi:hypothetical protein